MRYSILGFTLDINENLFRKIINPFRTSIRMNHEMLDLLAFHDVELDLRPVSDIIRFRGSHYLLLRLFLHNFSRRQDRRDSNRDRSHSQCGRDRGCRRHWGLRRLLFHLRQHSQDVRILAREGLELRIKLLETR